MGIADELENQHRQGTRTPPQYAQQRAAMGNSLLDGARACTRRHDNSGRRLGAVVTHGRSDQDIMMQRDGTSYCRPGDTTSVSLLGITKRRGSDADVAPPSTGERRESGAPNAQPRQDMWTRPTGRLQIRGDLQGRNAERRVQAIAATTGDPMALCSVAELRASVAACMGRVWMDWQVEVC